jgi:hypothetical protein
MIEQIFFIGGGVLNIRDYIKEEVVNDKEEKIKLKEKVDKWKKQKKRQM